MRRTLLPLLAALPLAGCRSAPEAPKEALALSVLLPKDRFRPGEMVVAKVRLRNLSGRARVVARLQPTSVGFTGGRSDGARELRLLEVAASPLEAPSEPIVLEPQGSEGSAHEREFGLPLAAPAPGLYALLASYRPGASAGEDAGPRVDSPAAYYTVQGEPLFERDARGLLTEAAAIEKARAALGKSAPRAKARLGTGPDEEGRTPLWRVNLYGEGEGPPIGAFRVNAYTGKAYPAEPFEAEKRVDAVPPAPPPRLHPPRGPAPAPPPAEP